MPDLSVDDILARADRAAAPLWTGYTFEVLDIHERPDGSAASAHLDVPPGTEVAVYATDQTPPGVTRDQIDAVVFQWLGSVIADWTAVNGLQVTEAESFRVQDQLVERLWALLAGEGST